VLSRRIRIWLVLGTNGLLASSLVSGVESQPNPVPIERAGRAGFADQSGRLVIPPQFAAAKPFGMGLAPVRDGACWRYIDVNGRVVLSDCFEDAGTFTDRLAPVRRNGRWGFVDRTGVLKVSYRYEFVRAFASGLAPVRRDSRWYFIDTAGAEVLAPAGGYEDAREFGDGLAPVRLQGKWGYIDRSGAMVIPARFSDAKPFAAGLAPVRSEGNSLYGFIDRTGDYVLQPQFNWAEPFSEGVSAVRIEDLWGYIDRTGRQVLAPQFIHAESFRDGLARVVGPSNHRVYVNRRGQLIVAYSDRPATGLGAGGRVNLRVTSAPAGAAVYLFPRRIWETDSALRADRQRWMVFRVAEGDTDVTARVFEKVYIAVFENCGTTQTRLVDVLPEGENTLHAAFPNCPRSSPRR
jgi:hypothetical protein